MNTIPKVPIKAERGGWSARCSACNWEMWHGGRAVLDRAAYQHQNKCHSKGAKANG